ncbi:hypothetical protein [Paenibacillus faecalis]|uniref:hypothetical protein n=1 Tax=Paenibacillus faecalis TaxID=2079532 RepID=UPI000D0F42D2|nr:hypothetical protein [Paenibacillus faecalis]
MNKLIVTYHINNEFAGSDRLKMSEQRVEHIDVESDLRDSKELVHTEVKQKLSEVEGLPLEEIKVTGMAMVRYTRR